MNKKNNLLTVGIEHYKPELDAQKIVWQERSEIHHEIILVHSDDKGNQNIQFRIVIPKNLSTGTYDLADDKFNKSNVIHRSMAGNFEIRGYSGTLTITTLNFNTPIFVGSFNAKASVEAFPYKLTYECVRFEATKYVA